MDIFDILDKILKRKLIFENLGMNKNEATNMALFDISNEYHISLYDIKRIYKV